jgi:hypothetical protein
MKIGGDSYEADEIFNNYMHLVLSIIFNYGLFKRGFG